MDGNIVAMDAQGLSSVYLDHKENIVEMKGKHTGWQISIYIISSFASFIYCSDVR